MFEVRSPFGQTIPSFFGQGTPLPVKLVAEIQHGGMPFHVMLLAHPGWVSTFLHAAPFQCFAKPLTPWRGEYAGEWLCALVSTGVEIYAAVAALSPTLLATVPKVIAYAKALHAPPRPARPQNLDTTPIIVY